jgi:hypothetical protein
VVTCDLGEDPGAPALDRGKPIRRKGVIIRGTKGFPAEISLFAASPAPWRDLVDPAGKHSLVKDECRRKYFGSASETNNSIAPPHGEDGDRQIAAAPP